jgi:hypothetical protein
MCHLVELAQQLRQLLSLLAGIRVLNIEIRTKTDRFSRAVKHTWLPAL